MVESVIKCYVLFYSCHARHGRTEVGIRDVVGTQHAKGRTSMRSSAPLSISPEIVGAASTTGRLPRGARAMEACSMRCIASGAKAPDLSLRGGRRPTWQSRGTCRIIGKTIGEIAAAFPRLHPAGISCASRSGRHGPSGPRNDNSGKCRGVSAPSTVEYSPTRRSLPVRGTPHP